VEDDPADIFLMQRACRRTNIVNNLKVVTDGQMAIDYLAGAGAFADREEYPLPWLIFLDLKLPYKGGFEVLKWMHTQPSLKDIIVAILSSSFEERDRKLAQNLGARSFLVKPPAPEMLMDLL